MNIKILFSTDPTGDSIFDDGLTQKKGIDCFHPQQNISHFMCHTDTSQGETATQPSLLGTLHMYV